MEIGVYLRQEVSTIIPLPNFIRLHACDQGCNDFMQSAFLFGSPCLIVDPLEISGPNPKWSCGLKVTGRLACAAGAELYLWMLNTMLAQLACLGSRLVQEGTSAITDLAGSVCYLFLKQEACKLADHCVLHLPSKCFAQQVHW